VSASSLPPRCLLFHISVVIWSFFLTFRFGFFCSLRCVGFAFRFAAPARCSQSGGSRHSTSSRHHHTRRGRQRRWGDSNSRGRQSRCGRTAVASADEADAVAAAVVAAAAASKAGTAGYPYRSRAAPYSCIVYTHTPTLLLVTISLSYNPPLSYSPPFLHTLSSCSLPHDYDKVPAAILRSRCTRSWLCTRRSACRFSLASLAHTLSSARCLTFL
jgi:hypothetical protein